MSYDSVDGDWCWTENEMVYVPEEKFLWLPEGHTSKPMRGYATIEAVFNSDSKCVGWISTTRIVL